MPHIPLVEDLTTAKVPAGSNLLVEYDSASQWYNASITIAAGWLKTGGTCNYDAMAQPPDDVRAQLRRLGLDLDQFEKEKKFEILDARPEIQRKDAWDAENSGSRHSIDAERGF